MITPNDAGEGPRGVPIGTSGGGRYGRGSSKDLRDSGCRAGPVYESLGPQGAARRRSGGAIVQPAAFDQMNVPLAVYHRIRVFVATV